MAPLKAARYKAIEEIEDLFSDYKFLRLRRDQFPAKGIFSAWRGSIRCEGKDVIIIVAIPISFPDELPRIYLAKGFRYLPIPHVDGNNLVCTFDTDNIDFFAERTKSLIQETIEKARGIVSDGIYRRNSNDFENEFLAYWPIGSNPRKIYSIFQPEDEIAEIQIGTVEGGINEIRYIVGNNEDDIGSYIKKFHRDATIKKLQTCLYLPLQRIPIPPFPENNKEILSCLKSINPDYEKAVSDFLSANEYQGTVIFSTKVNQQTVLAAWQHISPGEKSLTKGFRPGKINPRVLKARLSSQKIIRCVVERIDSDRLQKRIGYDCRELKNKKICIIGCGSLGSHIAFYLSRSGIEKLTLIDNDELLPENVSRHLCGMNEINQDKVQVVARRIEGHFPHVRIETRNDMFHQVFIDNPEAIYSSDLIISATANTALERRINKIQIESPECPPVLYSWIEPYGIASHAVLIINGKGGCFDCCLNRDNLRYIFSVAEFREDNFTLQEAGCQTSYTPYSALEADQASSIATRLALAYLNGEVYSSTRYVWLGDLNIMKNINVARNLIYKTAASYSLHKVPIERQQDCPYCT
ncbi:MAG: ThiF family adenylyltransferase [Desulfobacteraceae bacterium]|nr:ThiF family adenylyltransferase [Desulfobacteraceae bacterium]